MANENKPRATTIFKIINFELFVKPRLWVGVLGSSCALVSVWFLYNENKKWTDTKSLREQEKILKDEKAEKELERRIKLLENSSTVKNLKEKERILEEKLK